VLLDSFFVANICSTVSLGDLACQYLFVLGHEAPSQGEKKVADFRPCANTKNQLFFYLLNT
jgi:hypothetical protein